MFEPKEEKTESTESTEQETNEQTESESQPSAESGATKGPDWYDKRIAQLEKALATKDKRYKSEIEKREREKQAEREALEQAELEKSGKFEEAKLNLQKSYDQKLAEAQAQNSALLRQMKTTELKSQLIQSGLTNEYAIKGVIAEFFSQEGEDTLDVGEFVEALKTKAEDLFQPATPEQPRYPVPTGAQPGGTARAKEGFSIFDEDAIAERIRKLGG
jgi:hypothetical protein